MRPCRCWQSRTLLTPFSIASKVCCVADSASEMLRRYLEQRRETGETELVLDGMTVEDVMKIVGARSGGARQTATSVTPAPAAAPAPPAPVATQAAPAPVAAPAMPAPTAIERVAEAPPVERADARGAPGDVGAGAPIVVGKA